MAEAIFTASRKKKLSGYFYGDSHRKNSQSAIYWYSIFTDTEVLYIISQHHKRVYIELRLRTNPKEGAQSTIHSLQEINLNINFKAQNPKSKTDTNPIPDPNRYRRRCPYPNARIQKFYTLYRNTTKELT